jgi:hypothetical protein
LQSIKQAEFLGKGDIIAGEIDSVITKKAEGMHNDIELNEVLLAVAFNEISGIDNQPFRWYGLSENGWTPFKAAELTLGAPAGL